jgi:hypothetical protein
MDVFVRVSILLVALVQEKYSLKACCNLKIAVNSSYNEMIRPQAADIISVRLTGSQCEDS